MNGFLPLRWIVRISAATLLCSGLIVFDSQVFAEPRVGGLDELVIYEPGTHDRGLPAVEFVPSVEGTQIDIQPTTHVHRYYYNGNKEYQGPLIKGGPTVVVATHPRTSKRMYIDVNLPSGAPVIVYDKNSITYVFQERRVVISFAPICDEKAHVTYLPGRGIVRAHHEHVMASRRQHALANQQDSLNQSIHAADMSLKKVICGSTATVAHVTGSAIDHVKKTAEALPPVIQIQSMAQQRAEKGLRDANTRAQVIQDQTAPVYVPTIR